MTSLHNFALEFLIFLVIVITVIYLGVYVQSKQNLTSIDFCDKTYGQNNWTFVDITGTEEADEIAGRFYLGQVWICKSKENQSIGGC